MSLQLASLQPMCKRFRGVTVNTLFYIEVQRGKSSPSWRACSCTLPTGKMVVMYQLPKLLKWFFI